MGRARCARGADLVALSRAGHDPDADSRALLQVVPTVAPPAGSAHSVAVDPVNNHAIVPLPANNRIDGCAFGCFRIYGVPREHD